MEFMHLGIKISVSDPEIRRIVLERLGGEDLAAELISTPPRIGTEWSEHGGIYAGVVRGRDGAPDTHLIIGPAYEGDLTWDEAVAFAKGVTQKGFTDWRLFYRPEGAVAYANVPELFAGKTHWTCEQHADYPGYAWYQHFSNGTQRSWGKDGKLRARAVRSVIIQ
jgi:hypothetical protein